MIGLGSIVRIDGFQVEPGVERDKYLIIIGANPDCQTFLAVTTTSRSWRTPRDPICNANHEHPAFYLPQGSCYFQKETWVQIHRFYELKYDGLTRKIIDENFQLCAILPDSLLGDLIECARQSDFITQAQFAMLGIPPIEV